MDAARRIAELIAPEQHHDWFLLGPAQRSAYTENCERGARAVLAALKALPVEEQAAALGFEEVEEVWGIAQYVEGGRTIPSDAKLWAESPPQRSEEQG